MIFKVTGNLDLRERSCVRARVRTYIYAIHQIYSVPPIIGDKLPPHHYGRTNVFAPRIVPCMFIRLGKLSGKNLRRHKCRSPIHASYRHGDATLVHRPINRCLYLGDFVNCPFNVTT